MGHYQLSIKKILLLSSSSETELSTDLNPFVATLWFIWLKQPSYAIVVYNLINNPTTNVKFIIFLAYVMQ